MKKEVIWIITCICLISHYVCSDEVELQDFLINPYRDLGLPPWSTMKQVKARYLELSSKFHNNNTQTKAMDLNYDLKRIQRAYDLIKSNRKFDRASDEESEDYDSGIKSALFETVKVIAQVIVAIWICFGILWLIYRIYSFLLVPLICLVIGFFLIDRLIPHYFKNASNQYLFALLVSVGLFIIQKVARWMLRKFLKGGVAK